MNFLGQLKHIFLRIERLGNCLALEIIQLEIEFVFLAQFRSPRNRSSLLLKYNFFVKSFLLNNVNHNHNFDHNFISRRDHLCRKNIFIHPAKVNLLNLGFNGKISHRRSLNAEILPIVMDRPNLTVIDLGSKASGVYVPKAKSNDSEIGVRIEDL